MKLKKVLAVIIAAVMALTTMVVTSMTASAENEIVLWEGSTDMGTSWGSNVSASNITANEGDKLVVSYTIGTAEYQQIKIMDGSWTPLTAPVTNAYDCVELAAGTSSYEVILNAADAAALTSSGIVISGYNVTVTKIAYVANSTGGTTPEPGTSCVLWEGSTATGSWSDSVIIGAGKFSDVTSAGKLVVTITDVTDGAQYGLRYIQDYEWVPIIDYSDAMTAGTTSFEYEVSDELLATLKNMDLVVTGHDFTITKIEYVANSTGTEIPDEPGIDEPIIEEPVVKEPEVVPNVISSVTIPANSTTKFEITDPKTGKVISASVNKLSKALSRLTEGSEIAFDTGDFGLVLKKTVIEKIIENDLTLVINTSKATFIIDADNLAKVKTINIPAIMKTPDFKKLIKEGDTFNIIVTEKNKVKLELA